MVSPMYQLHYQSISCIKLSFELCALLEGGTTQNAEYLTLGSGHHHAWIIQCYFKDKIFKQSDSSIKDICDKPTQTEIRFKNYPYNYQHHSSQYTTLIVVLTSDALLAEDIYDKWIRYKTHDKYPCVYPLSNQLHLLFHRRSRHHAAIHIQQ